MPLKAGTVCLTDRMERDKEFATRKAERANLRVLLRDKYRLPEVPPSPKHRIPAIVMDCTFFIQLSFHYDTNHNK